MNNTRVTLVLVSGLLLPVSVIAQTAAPAAAAPARGGRGGAAAATATPAAATAMEQGVAAQAQAASAARGALIIASFAEPSNNADLQTKIGELRDAEQLLASARAEAFAALQTSGDALTAPQIQAFIATQLAGGGAAGGRAGGAGGRGGGGIGPNRLAGQELPPSPISLQGRVRQLDAILGSQGALEESKRIAMDANATVEARRAALQIIVNRKGPEVKAMAVELLKAPGVNTVAAGALSSIDDPTIGPMLVASYPQFRANDRPELIAALSSRAGTAKALVDAVADGRIPRNEVSASAAHQIANLGNTELTAQLTKVWGNLRESEAGKKEEVAKWKALMSPANMARADRVSGQALFTKTCAACHTIYGTGGNIGPELTGTASKNLDYLLLSIADPSAAVAQNYMTTTASLKDGRSVDGLVATDDARVLVLKTPTGVVNLQKSEIESTRQSQLSIMPEGLLQGLTNDQLRDLFAYLIAQQ